VALLAEKNLYFSRHTETANSTVYFYINTTLIIPSSTKTVPEFVILAVLALMIAIIPLQLSLETGQENLTKHSQDCFTASFLS
jgi:hypothetical protein